MKQPARNRAPLPHFRPLTLALAVSTALASLPAQAGVEIAQQPLLIAEPVPPNIMLIIDDSGSMNDASMCMPGYTSCSSGANHITYTRNGLAYNPAQTYKPWANADGSLKPDADRKAASGSNVNLTASITNLWASYRNFNVPQNIAVGDTGNSSLYRWVLGNDKSSTSNPGSGTIAKAWRCTSVGSDANPTTPSSNCTEVASLTWEDPEGGTISRSIEDEWQNYANWFHYYRGRTKMAKAAVSHAFVELDEGFRVGYRTINNGVSAFNIPVTNDNGLFKGENKQTFYDKLFATVASGGTPLRQSLDSVGQYFRQTTSSGPWGPGDASAQLACRQNFAILTTDGGWNGAAAGTAGARENTDGTAGPTHTDAKGTNTYPNDPTSPYMDGRSNTLADVAMYYWKNDLRPDMANNVGTTANNPAFWQHMRTFGISIGMYGSVKPEGPYPAWNDPSIGGDSSPSKIDDLLHASLNGRGEFLTASNPENFSKALVDALNTIATETKYEASGGTSSTEVKAGAKTFFSRYTSGTWDGNIVAFSINATTGLQDSDELWNAESKLPAWNSRNIYVNVDGTAKEFLYSNLSGTQKSHLSSDLVDYLRGDRSKEEDKPGGTLRQRAGVLPAFINSQLVYVAATEHGNYYGKFSFASAIAYATYVTAQKDRKPVIYIAGNNGMLHAFNADSGEEIYAFLPNSSISEKLSNYADKEYGSRQTASKPHQYILDGELTVADAYLGGTWKTILVATQGRGGSGVFALDITDPDDIKFLWEKSATDHDALGNNLGKPVITQIAEGEWRVILGNGPNSNGDRAQLLMFDLATGAFTPVDTGAGVNNGLAAVNSWDSDGDGFHDSAYAGDLRGNVWRFRNLATSPTAAILFAGGLNRPITAAPLVLLNQKTGATWVYVGTGQYLNTADLKNTNTQTWYGLIDNGTTITHENKLLQRKLTASGSTTGGGVGRILESGTEWEIINKGKRGWFINFSLPGNNGERMMTPNFILGGALFGITFTPEVTDPCQPDGSSSIWAINPFSGGRIDQGVFGSAGANGIFNFFTINGVFLSVQDGLPAITSGALPIGISADGNTGYLRVGPGPGGDIQFFIPKGTVARQSWREIVGQ